MYTPENGISLKMLQQDVEFLKKRYTQDVAGKSEGRLVIRSVLFLSLSLSPSLSPTYSRRRVQIGTRFGDVLYGSRDEHPRRRRSRTVRLSTRRSRSYTPRRRSFSSRSYSCDPSRCQVHRFPRDALQPFASRSRSGREGSRRCEHCYSRSWD